MYLHHVLDLWVVWWRRHRARGDVIIVRFADDFVCGFQHLGDARQFLRDLRERFAKFGLELHPDKTRLIEFGRFAAANRADRGLGKPETFGFPGFTHLCGKTRSGRFQRVKDQVKSRMHQPIPEQGRWLASVVRGHMTYYAVPGNFRAVAAFRDQVIRHWFKALRRRSQRTTVDWARMNMIQARWLPRARITHPYPDARFDARTQGRSPVR